MAHASGSNGGRPELDVLVAAALDGDRRALDAVLAIVRPVVVRYCRARIDGRRGGVAADDVAQEVLLAVFRSLSSYEEQGRSFLAFVYGIAAHKVADARRTAGRDRLEPTDDVPDTDDGGWCGPERAALAGADRELLASLLTHVTPRQREILVMRIGLGLSADETAEALGSSPGAVRVAQHRALARLRELV